MRKVLHAVDSLQNGGAERQLTLMCTHPPKGWSAVVFSLDDGPYAGVLRRQQIDVTVVCRRFRFDFGPGLALLRHVLRLRPDVVHSWSWMTTLSLAPICRLLGIPVIDGSIRDARATGRRMRVRRLCYRLATNVVSNSQAGLTAWSIPARKARLVYNGFDPGRLALCPRDSAWDPRPHGSDDDGEISTRLTVAMVARMSPVKDFNTCLAAARLLLEAGDMRWRFALIGDGPLREPLMTASSDLVDAGIVEFPQGNMEVLGLLRGVHVGILLTEPSLHAEGCANAIMEYMACGLPVVCTDSGGNRELVADGVTGFVIPPGNPQALVEALNRLAVNPARAREMGQAGRKVLNDGFSVDAMSRTLGAVYDDLLHNEGVAS